MRRARLTMTFVLFSPISVLAADLPSNIVAEKRVSAATELVFTEGPAYHNDGSVFFSDLPGNRILQWAPGALHAHDFIRPSGRANGLMFDSQGRLVACEGNEHGGLGGRRLVRYDLRTRERTVIVDKYQGKRFNSPNDLCIDNQGRIYFTDPYYGPLRDGVELDVEGVYRVDPDGKNLLRILGKDQVERPNGIALSADNRTLFLCDSNNAPGGSRKFLSFALDAEGVPTGSRKVLYDFGTGRGGDGVAIDVEDNIYVTAGADQYYKNSTLENKAGVYVFSASGKLHGIIPVPEDMVANCCFGGPDLKTLYITAGKTLWKIRVKIPGRLIWPRAQ